jgi:mRNA interferase RelE/StbE
VNFEFKKSFSRDLKKRANQKRLLEQVQEIIKEVENADNIYDIRNLKNLKSEGNYYRIKHGDYRIGLIIENDTVYFVRFLHRREIYRYFP